jgi:hypothetical protein
MMMILLLLLLLLFIGVGVVGDSVVADAIPPPWRLFFDGNREGVELWSR